MRAKITISSDDGGLLAIVEREALAEWVQKTASGGPTPELYARGLDVKEPGRTVFLRLLGIIPMPLEAPLAEVLEGRAPFKLAFVAPGGRLVRTRPVFLPERTKEVA